MSKLIIDALIAEAKAKEIKALAKGKAYPIKLDVSHNLKR